MRIGPTIHYIAGHNYIRTYIIIVQELMNLQLCMEIGFSLGGFLCYPFQFCPNHNEGQLLHVHVHTLVQLLLEEANTHSGTVGFAPENYNEPQLFR